MLTQFLATWAVFYLCRYVMDSQLTKIHSYLDSHSKYDRLRVNLEEHPWREEYQRYKWGGRIGHFVRIGLMSFLFTLPENSWIPIYHNISDYGWLYLGGSSLVYFLYWDLGFYLGHRFLFHHKSVYKSVHLIHHKFRDPTLPVRGAFAVSEVILTDLIGSSILLFMPLHPISILFAREILVPAANIINHLGYEFFPARFTRHPFFKYITTSTHHTLHHMHNNSNYALMVNYDLIFKTQHKKYHETFDAITARPPGVLASRAESKSIHETFK